MCILVLGGDSREMFHTALARRTTHSTKTTTKVQFGAGFSCMKLMFKKALN